MIYNCKYIYQALENKVVKLFGTNGPKLGEVCHSTVIYIQIQCIKKMYGFINIEKCYKQPISVSFRSEYYVKNRICHNLMPSIT